MSDPGLSDRACPYGRPTARTVPMCRRPGLSKAFVVIEGEVRRFAEATIRRGPEESACSGSPGRRDLEAVYRSPAKRNDHRRYVNPADYGDALLRGEARSARDLMLAAQRQLGRA